MFKLFHRLGLALAAGLPLLLLAGCGNSNSPSAPSNAVGGTQATSVTGETANTSALVEGTVVDSANRPLANITIECLGDVECSRHEGDVSAQGHEHQILTTSENGTFQIHVVPLPGHEGTTFFMNANASGYDSTWRVVQWPGANCSADQARCAVQVDFQLNPIQDQ